MLELDEARPLVLDEVHRRPDLFPALRVLADRPRTPARFLVLGSASEDLLRQSSESLAGRIAFHELRGFSLQEVGTRAASRLWLRVVSRAPFWRVPKSRACNGAKTSSAPFWNAMSHSWYHDSSNNARTFLGMLGALPWTIWNAAEFARAFGVSNMTVGRYLDLLERLLVVRRLGPWFENLGKRQVKAPKVYIADQGLLHALLGIRSQADLERHPKIGASWEGYGLQEVIDQLGARRDECHFWATHGGAELDLLVVRGRKRLGFEFKRTTSPAQSPSMLSALADLRLDRLDVIHAGRHTFRLSPRIRAVAFERILEDLRPLA